MANVVHILRGNCTWGALNGGNGKLSSVRLAAVVKIDLCRNYKIDNTITHLVPKIDSTRNKFLPLAVVIATRVKYAGHPPHLPVLKKNCFNCTKVPSTPY